MAKVDEWLERHAAQPLHPVQLCLLHPQGLALLLREAGFAATGRVPRLPGCEKLRAEETEARWRDALFGTGRWTRTPGPAMPMCQAVLQSSQSDLRMLQAVRAARGYLARELASVSQRDFLFALRYILMHATVASAARPSVLYTLSTEAMEHPLGRWEDGRRCC